MRNGRGDGVTKGTVLLDNCGNIDRRTDVPVKRDGSIGQHKA